MESKTIKLTNLSINVDNPRYESLQSQKAAIEMIILDQKDKLFNLASDILEHGLNPLDMILVTPIASNRYLVLEGNRRVTALKLLQNTQLINDDMQSLRKRFENYYNGNYEYKKGKGWQKKDGLDESIRRAIRKVLH